MANKIIKMKYKPTGEIIYRPENHLKIFPKVLDVLPSDREKPKQATPAKKEQTKQKGA